LTQRLIAAQQRMVRSKAENFALQCEQLNLVSPLATIARGYSAVRGKKGQIIKSVADVKPQDNVSIEVSDGIIYAEVNKIQAN